MGFQSFLFVSTLGPKVDPKNVIDPCGRDIPRKEEGVGSGDGEEKEKEQRRSRKQDSDL